MNPLLLKFESPFETVPFNLIKEKHFLPALKEAITEGRKEIDDIKVKEEKPTFSNVCEALDSAGGLVGKVSSIFFNLHSAEGNDELQSIAKEFSPMLTEYSNDISLDHKLFEKIKAVYDQKDKLNLSAEEMTLVEKQYKGFVRNGALLGNDEKEKVREIDKELSSLRLHFGDNILKESNDFVLFLEDKKDLDGLPEDAIEAAAIIATEKGKEGQWAITLDYPSYAPFLKYAKNRSIRETLAKAMGSRAFKGNDYDNQENVKKITILRHKRANILGYDTHAHFVLEERMAKSSDTVKEFLNSFIDKAKPKAIEELEELKKYAFDNGGPNIEDFRSWDQAYWSNRLKEEKYDFDEQLLKPYFQLEKVIDGIFEVARKLYGLDFKERKDIATYHSDVKVFEVMDSNKKHIGVFYGDYFPREGKRNGAWMTSFREQEKMGETDIRPHISNVCNFTKPTDSKPSLLTFNEVLTIFHEFGHGLHGLLSNCRYSSLNGTNVYWDFVELPSQILENWAYEKECLDLFAVHFETGEKIPEDLIEKIKKSSSFQEGLQTMRQVSFALLDMGWHGQDPSSIGDVDIFEKEAMKECLLLPPMEGSNMSCAFSHIFSGGYSSGYYSYKWAEVLDADAFEVFKEKGIFNKETATSFYKNILSKGGSEHPMELYKRFRGKEPSPDALLKRARLI